MRQPKKRQFWERRTALVRTATSYRSVSGTGTTFLMGLWVLLLRCGASLATDRPHAVRPIPRVSQPPARYSPPGRGTKPLGRRRPPRLDQQPRLRSHAPGPTLPFGVQQDTFANPYRADHRAAMADSVRYRPTHRRGKRPTADQLGVATLGVVPKRKRRSATFGILSAPGRDLAS